MAESTFPTDLTLEGSIFQRVVAATGKTLVPILVLTSGTKSKSELDDRSNAYKYVYAVVAYGEVPGK